MKLLQYVAPDSLPDRNSEFVSPEQGILAAEQGITGSNSSHRWFRKLIDSVCSPISEPQRWLLLRRQNRAVRPVSIPFAKILVRVMSHPLLAFTFLWRVGRSDVVDLQL